MTFAAYTPPKTYVPPDRDPRDNDTAAARYAALHRIAVEFQAEEIDGVLIDANTACLMVDIADRVNDANRAMFLVLDIAKAGRIAWKLAK